MFFALISAFVAPAHAAPVAAMAPVMIRADLSDGQILDALISQQRGEIGIAQLVMTRTMDPRVRELADTMEAMHSANLVDAQRLGGDATTLLSPSEEASGIERAGRNALRSLGHEPVGALDLAWLDHTIEAHEVARMRIDAWSATASPDVAFVLEAARVTSETLRVQAEELRLRLVDELGVAAL